MNRRSFLSGLIATPVAALFGAAEIVKALPSKRVLTQAEKDALIAAQLRTPQGRAKLAAAMMQPLRCGGRDYPRARA